MQSAKLLEPPSPKLLPTRPQFIRGRYALHLIIAQDRTASSLIHANRSHRFGSVFGLWLACIDVSETLRQSGSLNLPPTFRTTKYGGGGIAAATQARQRFW
ncbi:hypothetical protein ACVIHC_007289 [Bradyrhizobium diazoefficiens]